MLSEYENTFLLFVLAFTICLTMLRELNKNSELLQFSRIQRQFMTNLYFPGMDL